MRVLEVESGLADDRALRVTLDKTSAWVAVGADARVVVLAHEDEGRPVRVPAGLG